LKAQATVTVAMVVFALLVMQQKIEPNLTVVVLAKEARLSTATFTVTNIFTNAILPIYMSINEMVIY
jgi:hypothetical protein